MAEFRVSRECNIAASPQRIYSLINDLRAWQKWSPWEGLDDALMRTYSDPSSGVGATYEWSGNKKAGAGHMRIAESSPERIIVDLTFTAPFESENTCIFDIASRGDKTNVRWTMTGPQSAMQRILFTVMRMNAQVAKEFDKGLSQLEDAAREV